MPKLRFKDCDYVCEGKGTKRGFRVYCRKTDKKCKPTKTQISAASLEAKTILEIQQELKAGLVDRGQWDRSLEASIRQKAYKTLLPLQTEKNRRAAVMVPLVDKLIEDVKDWWRDQKEPWEMTSDEFDETRSQLYDPQWDLSHKDEVEDAIARGEKVPDDVLRTVVDK